MSSMRIPFNHPLFFVIIVPLVCSMPAVLDAGICVDYETYNSGTVTWYMSAANRDVEGRVILHGDASYVGGIGVHVFDLSDPAKPALEGLCTGTTNRCQPLLVAGDWLFIVDRGTGLISFDLANPLEPAPVDTLVLVLDDAAYSGGYIFGLDGADLSIIDAVDPAALQHATDISLPEAASAVAIDSERLYVAPAAADSWLRIYNLEDPLAPVLSDSLLVTGRTESLTIEDDQLFVPLLDANELRIYDISAGFAPVLLGTHGTGELGCKRVAVAGSSAIVVTTRDFSDAGYQCELVDVGDPGLPNLVHTFTNFYSPSGVAARNGFAYVKDGTSLTTFDFAGGFADWLGTGTGTTGRYVVTAGSLVAVAPTNGFALYDVSDPTAPSQVGVSALDHTYALAMSDSVVFQGSDDCVNAYDISDPSLPVFLDSLPIKDGVQQVLLHEDHLVLCESYTDVHVVDVSDPGAMSLVGSLTMPSPQSVYDGMAASWPYVYILDRNVGDLHVIDLTDPGTPTYVRELSQVRSGITRGCVAASDGLLFVTSISWVKVYDLADPSDPVLLSADFGYAQPGIDDLAVHDRIVYCKLTRNNIAIRDYTDPTSPRQIGWFNVDASSWGGVLAVSDHGLAIAGSSVVPGGLGMAPLHCTRSTVDVPPPVDARSLACVPNPFNPRTRLEFTLDTGGVVELEVYDVAGRRVDTLHSGWLDAGGQAFVWDGRSGGRTVASGNYFFRLSTPHGVKTTRGVLVR